MSGNEAQAELDLDIGEDDGTEVEVTLEEPKQNAANAVEIEGSENDDEFKRSENQTQKRINRLTKKMREAERQREEALLYAKNVKTESDQVKAKLNTVDQGYLNEYGGRITAESTAAKEAFKRAIAVGDPEGTLAAQTKLNELHYAETKLNEANID